jgi:chromosome segregation ATPase
VRDSSSQMQTELQKMQALVASTTEQLKTQASQDLQRLDGVVAAERDERVKSMEEKSAEWEAALKKASEDWQAAGAQEKERGEAAAALLSQRVENLESKERELATGAEKSGADAAVKLQALDDKHKELLEILATTKGELDEKLGASKSELEEKLAAEQQKQEGNLQALETKLNEKIDGGSAASSKEIGEKVEQLGQRVEELGGKVEAHAAKIEELEESKASAGKLDSDMHEVSLLRERVVAMEAKTSALDTDALSQKVEAVDAKITALEGSYVKTDALDAALNENQNVVDLELKPLKSQMAELASKLTALEGGGGVSEEAVAALQCIQKLQQDLRELDAERQRSELHAWSTDVDTKVEALRTRIVPLEEMAEKNAGNAAGAAAGAAQLAEVKEALEREIKDMVGKVEENLNFRLDQMKVDELSKKVGDLTVLGNVNSQNINGLDKKVNEMKDIIEELVEDSNQEGAK